MHRWIITSVLSSKTGIFTLKVAKIAALMIYGEKTKLRQMKSFDKSQLKEYLSCWTLHEKCPNTEFFWSVFSFIRTEYRKTRTRKNSVFGHFSGSGNDLKDVTNQSLNRAKVILQYWTPLKETRNLFKIWPLGFEEKWVNKLSRNLSSFFSSWIFLKSLELQLSVPVKEMCLWLVFFELFDETCRLLKRLVFRGYIKVKFACFL